jgi:hypothetical protein
MIKRLTLILSIILPSYLCFSQSTVFEIGEMESEAFKSFISTKQVISIGDLHGTKECPEFFLQLIHIIKRKEKKITVVLEINSNYQKDIDKYLKEGDFDKLLKIEFFRYPDGRTSIAMGELLKELRMIEGIKVVCYDFDLTTGLGEDRDSIMAVNLMNNLTHEPMVILTGSMHSSLKDGCCGRPGFKSALFRFKKLKNLDGKLISLNTRAGGGSFWGCRNNECKEWEFLANNKNINEGLKSKSFINIYEKEDETGFNGFIYFNKVNASFPLEKKE